MPLKIDWQPVVFGPRTQLCVPFLDAKLILTLVRGVIIDASWMVDGDDSLPMASDLADQVKTYLLNPNDYDLELNLLIQGSLYAQRVWEALLEIPVGQVMSYSGLAEKLGSGPRAIAQACRNNPYAGIIPCHRVVAKTGVGGFMGHTDGAFVALKRRLLVYESGISGNQP